MIEVIVKKTEHLKVNQVEEAAAGVDGAIELATTEVKANHMTRNSITLDTIP